MNDRTIEDLRRENEYLKLRNAQLQRDLTSVEADSSRLRQELERRMGARVATHTPNPLSGGQ